MAKAFQNFILSQVANSFFVQASDINYRIPMWKPCFEDGEMHEPWLLKMMSGSLAMIVSDHNSLHESMKKFARGSNSLILVLTFQSTI